MSDKNDKSIPLADISAYANVFSFVGLPLSRDIDQADAVVMGIPYDLGHQWSARSTQWSQCHSSSEFQFALGGATLALGLCIV